MSLIKLSVILLFTLTAVFSCSKRSDRRYSIAESKAYEASVFRQNCTICHGPEGDGKTLDDGRIVPSLREGELKKISGDDIYKQIADGGEGMTPFRMILTERELKMMANFVRDDLRKH